MIRGPIILWVLWVFWRCKLIWNEFGKWKKFIRIPLYDSDKLVIVRRWSLNNLAIWFIRFFPEQKLIKFYFIMSLQDNPSRWHKILQVYVASFTFLNKLQETSNNITNSKDPASKELFELNISARGLLCFIENLVNTTNKPHFLTREYMKNHIKLRNYKDIDFIDLIFVKHNFTVFVKNLDRRLRSPNALAMKSLNRRIRKKNRRNQLKEKKRVQLQQDNFLKLTSNSGNKKNRGERKLPTLSRQGRMIIVRPQN